jgi:hypothetical protein
MSDRTRCGGVAQAEACGYRKSTASFAGMTTDTTIQISTRRLCGGAKIACPKGKEDLTMKKLMVQALVGLLFFGVVSVSWAEDAAAGGQPVGAEPQQSLPQKMRKPKPMKNPRKGSKGKTPTPAPQ